MKSIRAGAAPRPLRVACPTRAWVLGCSLIVFCGLITASPYACGTDEATDSIPDTKTLEATHAIVGTITIVNGNVFATETPADDNPFFRLANRFHIKTRPKVIERQLLFHSGDVYSDRLLRESERILRANRYLYDATIAPVKYHDGVVDLEVRTRDVWTFKPTVKFSRQGGKNSSGFELQESNLLGYGKEITVARRQTVDRTTGEYRYYDPQVFGSWYRFLGSYSRNSDGYEKLVSAERPFYSLDTRWAAYTSALDWERDDARYNLGEVVDRFHHRLENYDAGFGWSSGRQSRWIRRLTVGATYSLDEFTALPGAFANTNLPADRVLAYPYVGITLLQDDFQTRRNLNQIERTEDIYSGTYLQASLGRTMPAFGGDRSAWMWRLGAGKSWESLGRVHTLQLAANANGRIQSGDFVDSVVSGSATYYWRVAPRQLFYASLQGIASKRLDADKQILLGGDSGLRGYPLRYQDGSADMLLTLEHRVYTNIYLFRLFYVGGAAFFDMGRTWGRGNSALANPAPTLNVAPNQGLLKDIGLGLRFGSSRSAFGNVIHVDLAFPLDGDPSIKKVQFVVETKQSF